MEEKENTKWIIWSIEHDGWWRANSRGYTEHITEAGVYSYQEALKIVEGANYAMTLPDGDPNVDGVDKSHNTPFEAMILVTPAIKRKMDL